MPHDWLGSDVICDAGFQEEAVSGEWVIGRSQQNADWSSLVFCLSGGVAVFGFGLLQTCNLLGKCLPTEQGSSLLVFEVLEVMTHMDGREPKAGT